MAFDHNRLGLENKLLEKNFLLSTSLLYKNLGV